MVEPSVFQYRVAPSPPEPVMAMVNPITPMLNPNAKDSRWLTLEVCREYQRNKCTRTENECKFAHPPAHVEVQNGRVIACFDSIKVGASQVSLSCSGACDNGVSLCSRACCVTHPTVSIQV